MKKLFSASSAWLWLLTLGCTVTVRAMVVTDLYQAEVPLVAQTEELREKAMQEGLLQVLRKLTNNPLIEQNPIIKANVQRADYYVQEFHYAAPTMASSEYQLQIRFEKADIDRLIKKAGLVAWGENRPAILVWMTEENGTQMNIIGNETAGPLFNQLKAAGAQRGLAFIFPFMDMSDLTQVTVEDIATPSLPTLQRVSKRYSPNALLIGRVRYEGNIVRSEWQLICDNEQWYFKSEQSSLTETVSTMTSQVGQTLAHKWVG